MKQAIVKIWQDSDTEDPTSYDQFKVHSFSRRHMSFTDPKEFLDDTGNLKVGLRAKLRAGTAFKLSYYEHGQCTWFLMGDDKPGVEFQWDGTRFAGLLIWTGKPNGLGSVHTPEGRREQAKQFIETYTNWCNGDCFGYTIEDAESGETLDSCGGFIGFDYCKQAAKDAIPKGYTVDLESGQHVHRPAYEYWQAGGNQ